jgi:hypothetical protein
MSWTELEHLFLTMLGVKRIHASTNRSHGGDIPQDQGTLHPSPDNWTFVGKTLPRPFSYEGSDAGYRKSRPHKTSHAGLYACGAAKRIRRLIQFGTRPLVFVEQSRSTNASLQTTEDKRENTVTVPSTKMVPSPIDSSKVPLQVTKITYSTEEFLDILNEINLADEFQDQIVEHSNKNEQVKSLKKSIKTIVQYSRLLRSSRSALKATTQHHPGTSFNYHTQQAFSTPLDQSLQIAHLKDPTDSETFQGVNIPRRLVQRDFTRHQRNQHLQAHRNLTKRLRQYDQHQSKQDYQLPRPNWDVTYNHPNHIWKQKYPVDQ